MSFRSALLASAAILTAGSAFAADLPARVAPAPYIAAPIFTWTGFYVGLNAGAGFNGGNRHFSEFGYYDYNTAGSIGSNNDTGFTGGLQVGYNWQFGSFVAGVETDINYIDRSNGNSFSYTPYGGYEYVLGFGDSNNWFGTVRGRLGYAVDRALFYATGGFAYGGKIGGASGTYHNLVLTTSDNNGSSTGWTLGGGMEYAFSNAWTVRLEYLHVDLGSTTRTLFATPTTGINISTDNKFDVVRAGVNFRF